MTNAGHKPLRAPVKGQDRTPSSMLWYLSAPMLILVTPVVAFAAYHNYSYFTVEWFAGLAISAIVGLALGLIVILTGRRTSIAAFVVAVLLGLFVDLQFPVFLQAGSLFWSVARLTGIFAVFFVAGLLLHRDLMQITATIFATMVAATLLIPQQTAPPLLEKTLSAGMQHQDLPPIIHIVLDEFIGVEGIPTDIDGGKDLKEELKSFYLDKGFHVFGKAFSSFYHTVDSMSHLLNPSESYARGLTKPGGKWVEYELNRSEYFSRLEERGYIFNINQLSHLNYCNAVKTRLAKCRTARANTAKLLQNLPVSWPGKFRVLASLYFSQSLTWRAIRTMYRRISAMISSAGLPLPIWQWERPRAGPLGALESFDFLERDLRTASRGEYHFAHMVGPHSPHVYDRNCVADEPSEWTGRRIPEALSKLSNTPETRRHRYKRYFEQVRCLQKRIADLLAFIDRSSDLNDAVLILHGDHGSRITLWEPRSSNKERLVQSDFVDGYSTLFVIRGPGIPAGYDMRLISIQGLFGHFMENGFTSLPGAAYHTGEPTILLHGGAGRDIVPMVDFGDTGVGGG